MSEGVRVSECLIMVFKQQQIELYFLIEAKSINFWDKKQKV